MIKEEFDIYIKSLKETSKYSNDNKSFYYITQSLLQVYDFDAIKDKYIKSFSPESKPFSNDALFYDKVTDNYYFIEFKSGNINVKLNVEIMFKMYDSLLIFLDLINKTIDYSRMNINYILVFDDKKEHKSDLYKLKNYLSISNSLREIQQYTSKKANKKFINFGLARFQKIFFKQVFTYSFEEFEKEFVQNFS